MNREEATEQILEAKKEQDLTFEAIARRAVGRTRSDPRRPCWYNIR